MICWRDRWGSEQPPDLVVIATAPPQDGILEDAVLFIYTLPDSDVAQLSDSEGQVFRLQLPDFGADADAPLILVGLDLTLLENP